MRMPRLPIARPRFVALLLAGLLTVGTASVAGATEFPAGRTGYHSYTEMAAEVAAVAAAHPSIVQRFSIGKSYQGRQLWAVKISDNVAVDEAEPEVMFDGTHHADEHMATEMTLHIFHWLVDGYGHDPRITSIVDTREIWIVFVVNPDGAEYDISGGKFHHWRKNRQPTPGTSSIGTDLNRNYGYHWGGGGRTSSNPAAITYRGTKAFSTPEARAMRDFLASRVVNGRQQIRAAISFHEDGRLVMWPYGYTLANVPADMTSQDHAALAVMGKHMAATNRYKPEQASDLYISSGTSRDYQYGVYRIFAFTFEMSVTDYPDDSLIASETGRNKEAVLYLMEQSGCPLSALGPRRADRPLRRIRRRPGGLPAGSSSIPTTPTRRGAAGSSGPTRHRRRATAPSSWGPRARARRRSSPAPRPARPRARTTSTGGRRSDPNRSPCRPPPASA